MRTQYQRIPKEGLVWLDVRVVVEPFVPFRDAPALVCRCSGFAINALSLRLLSELSAFDVVEGAWWF